MINHFFCIWKYIWFLERKVHFDFTLQHSKSITLVKMISTCYTQIDLSTSHIEILVLVIEAKFRFFHELGIWWMVMRFWPQCPKIQLWVSMKNERDNSGVLCIIFRLIYLLELIIFLNNWEISMFFLYYLLLSTWS